MKPNQRFIAGASCPNCGAIDSLLLNQDDQSIECVDCSYTSTAESRDSQSGKKKDGNLINIQVIK